MKICINLNNNILKKKAGLNKAQCNFNIPCSDTPNFGCVFTAESSTCLCDPLTALDWNPASMDCTSCKSGYAQINQGCCKYKLIFLKQYSFQKIISHFKKNK